MAKRFLLWVVIGLALPGCATHVARLRDTSSVYQGAAIQGASKIVFADLQDNRADKKKIGTISLLSLESATPINTVLTDRIAARLKDEGFNVTKTALNGAASKSEAQRILSAGGGDAFLSGGLDHFYIASSDAVLDKAKGDSIFHLKLYDSLGKTLLDKNYSAHAEHWIGLTGQWGSEKLIEDSIQASIDQVFKDEEFLKALGRIRR